MKTDETNPNDWFLLGRERLDAADAARSARGVCSSAAAILIMAKTLGEQAVSAPSSLWNSLSSWLWCGFGVALVWPWGGFGVALRWLCTPESMPSICLLYGFGVALGGFAARKPAPVGAQHDFCMSAFQLFSFCPDDVSISACQDLIR